MGKAVRPGRSRAASLGLVARLKQHHMFQVASWYATGSYVLILVANAVFPDIGLSRDDVRYLIGALALGFPVALTLGWIFIPPSREDPKGFTRWKKMRWRLGTVASVVVTAFVIVSGTYLWRMNERHLGAYGPGAKSVAVLPFENMSADPNNAYFSAGTQDEILTRLTQISALKVISRTSTMKYASHPEDLVRVGRELGVATVLEGSVQRAADTVRVNVQLIDTATDTHLWAESYDRDVKDIFAAETDIANKVAESLQAKLQPAESAGVARVPTLNAAAYDFYLKGQYASQDMAMLQRSDRQVVARQAIPFYTQAIALDPGFALAYAQRSQLQIHLYWETQVKDPIMLAAARADAEKAYGLGPDLPEAHLARGYVYYYGDTDYAKAAAEFARAQQLNPNDMETIMAVNYISRRRLDFAGAIANLQHAVELDPRHKDTYLVAMSHDYSMLSQYPKALALADQLLADHPDAIGYHNNRIFFLLCMGRLADAKVDLAATAGLGDDADGELAFSAMEIARLERDPKAMLKAIDGLKVTPALGAPLDSFRFQAYYMAGDKAGIQKTGDSALRQLRAMDAQGPNNNRIIASIAQIEAMRGDRDALQLMDRALALDPVARDPIDGPQLVYYLALVRLHLGMRGPALDALEQLVSLPVYGRATSAALLRIDPDWDSLRQEPRFQAIVAKAAAHEQ